MAKKKAAKKKSSKRKSKVTKKVTKRVTKRKVTKRRIVNPKATDWDFAGKFADQDFSGHLYGTQFETPEMDAWDEFIKRRLGR